MAKSIRIQHAQSGMVAKGVVGFSWTYLFFGWLVPLVRGELGIAVIHLVVTILTGGIWQIVLCFMYNKQFMRRKLEAGWILDPQDPHYLYAAMKLGIPVQTVSAA